MDAVTKVLRYYDFEQITDTGSHLRACCKVHGGTNPSSFAINKTTGKWICFACGAKGRLPDLVKALSPEEKLEDILGEKFVVKQADLDREEARNFVTMNRIRDKPTEEVELIGEQEFNRFKQTTLDRFNAVAVDEVKMSWRRYNNKLVIPVDGGWGMRSLDGELPKWKYTYGVNLKQILFKMGTPNPHTIIVVEGMFDVFAFYEAMEEYGQLDKGIEVISTFTCHMSKEQANLLMLENCKIVLCYDGDEPGRKGTRQAIEMLNNKVDLDVITLPDGKDPDDVPRWWLSREVERFIK